MILKYGWHGPNAVLALMQEQRDHDHKTEYIATVLWSIGQIVGGENYPFPAYSEYMNPKPKDTRTTDDIVSGLIQKLSAVGGENKDG